MGVRKTLDNLVDKIRIPPKAVGWVSIPAIFSPLYLLLNSPFSSVRGTLLAPAMSGLAALIFSSKITDHINTRKAIKELGLEEEEFKKIDENVTKIQGKDRSLVQRVWDYPLLHPKQSGAAIGAAYTTYVTLQAGAVQNAARHIADGTFGRFLLNATVFDATLMAFSSLISYYLIKSLSPIASSYDAPTFFGLFPALFANNKTKIRALSEQIKKKPSKILKITLAVNLIKENELDSACIQAKEALSTPNISYLTTRKISETMKAGFAAEYDRFRKNAGALPSAIFLAWCCNELGHPETADDVLRQMSNAANSAEASALSALWLSEAFGRKEAAKAYWQDSALRLVSDDSAVVLPVGEGVNHVYRIGGKFMRSTLIFKEQPLSAREDERRVLAYVTSIPKEAKYTQPNEVAAFTYQKDSPRHALVLQYLSGKTLLEKARAGAVSYEDLLTVIDYASFLHRNLPLSLSAAGKVNLKDKLEAIVGNHFLGISEDLQKRIKHDAEFMAEDLTGYDVISLDSHAGNWHFGEDKRTSKLDYSAAKDSLFRDIAKLFAHPELLVKDDDIDSLQREAFKRYEGADFMVAGENDFRRLHLQAIPLQTLSFASAWSVPEMSHMRDKRVSALEGSGRFFGMLKQNHRTHYLGNRLSYDALESDFMKLKEYLAAQPA